MAKDTVHQLLVRTEVLDQIAKSVMLSITANTKRRRRLVPGSRIAREASEEGELLAEALQQITTAQRNSWEPR